MSRLLRLGVAAALTAGALLPAAAGAYTCRPYGVEPYTYTLPNGSTAEAYRLTWVC